MNKLIYERIFWCNASVILSLLTIAMCHMKFIGRSEFFVYEIPRFSKVASYFPVHILYFVGVNTLAVLFFFFMYLRLGALLTSPKFCSIFGKGAGMRYPHNFLVIICLTTSTSLSAASAASPECQGNFFILTLYLFFCGSLTLFVITDILCFILGMSITTGSILSTVALSTVMSFVLVDRLVFKLYPTRLQHVSEYVIFFLIFLKIRAMHSDTSSEYGLMSTRKRASVWNSPSASTKN